MTVDNAQEWRSPAGGGRVAQHTYIVHYKDAAIAPVQGMHVIWSDLIAHSDADTVRRLDSGPGMARGYAQTHL